MKMPSIRKVKFELQPKKTISKFVVPEIEKKVHEIEQTEADCKGSFDLEFFVETIRIQDRLNYK